ncbi:IS21 family transposase [Pelagibacterium lacus]|uniref:IS21 family transposase n=1 Tax=Pelagibacterium lacus TaxID=2282655 RepID=A0A369W6D3_9HYPH|nr:IS21 family transposase [Pelagibacterium lacus]RDE09579.1 IS21 family transposase [Pelagibacterium lacus]
MKCVDTIARVRRAYFVQGKSIKQIERELHVARNTVRKIIRSGETRFSYERETQPLPAIGPWQAELDRLLLTNEGKVSRERLTLIRIYEELCGLGYEGSYDAVRRYGRRWSRERSQSASSAYVPLSFSAGEAYQFDWSHEIVILNGTTVTIKVAHMRLCHSRMMFVRAYPRETQEMVFDAHDRAFAFFKGACTRGIYDNMKTAVETIFVGKERLYNRRFLQMCSHHLVDPVACTPASGWEKGQVENQVGLIRERFFTPRLRFASYEELNAWLLDKTIAYARAHKHPEFGDRTIWDVFEAERPSLVPFTGRFDGFHAVTASVAKTCLVRFDNNKYSVAAHAVGRPVEIRAYADRVEIRQDGVIVGEHARCFGRDQTLFDPWHYVPVLARKPGALRNGAPFKDWVLPASIEKIRRRLASANDGDRQMVSILTSVLSDGLPAVEAACAEALREGVAGTGLRVSSQGGHRECLYEGETGRFRTRPDLIVRQGEKIALIIDTKWKRMTPRIDDPKQGVSQADVYQLMAYGRLYNCPNVVLLYPHHGELPPDPIRRRYSIATKGADETLIVATQDLAGTQRDHKAALRQLVLGCSGCYGALDENSTTPRFSRQHGE